MFVIAKQDGTPVARTNTFRQSITWLQTAAEFFEDKQYAVFEERKPIKKGYSPTLELQFEFELLD